MRLDNTYSKNTRGLSCIREETIMYKSLLTKLKESDLPTKFDYDLNYLDDEGMEYLEKVYEENKSVS